MGNNKNKTTPEIRCNIEAIAIGGYLKLTKSRLTGLFLFTVGFFLNLEKVIKYSTNASIALCFYHARLSLYGI